MAAAQASFAPAPTQPRTRENTKQATIIALLRRPEGATIAQICSATDWRAHAVRRGLCGGPQEEARPCPSGQP